MCRPAMFKTTLCVWLYVNSKNRVKPRRLILLHRSKMLLRIMSTVVGSSPVSSAATVRVAAFTLCGCTSAETTCAHQPEGVWVMTEF